MLPCVRLKPAPGFHPSDPEGVSPGVSLLCHSVSMTTVETHSSPLTQNPFYIPLQPKHYSHFSYSAELNDVFFDQLGKCLKAGYSLPRCLFLTLEIQPFFLRPNSQICPGADSEKHKPLQSFLTVVMGTAEERARPFQYTITHLHACSSQSRKQLPCWPSSTGVAAHVQPV